MAQESLKLRRRRPVPKLSRVFGAAAVQYPAPTSNKETEALLRETSGGDRYQAPVDDKVAFETPGLRAPATVPVRGVDVAAVEGIVDDAGLKQAFLAASGRDVAEIPLSMHAVHYDAWEERIQWDNEAEAADEAQGPELMELEMNSGNVVWRNNCEQLPHGFTNRDKGVFLEVPRDSVMDVDEAMSRRSEADQAKEAGPAVPEKRKQQRTQEELQQNTRNVYRSLGMDGWTDYAASASVARTQAQQRHVQQARIQHPRVARQHVGVAGKLSPHQKRFFHRPRMILPRKSVTDEAEGGDGQASNPRSIEKQWRFLVTKRLVNRSLNCTIFRRSQSMETANVRKLTDLVLPIAGQKGSFVLLEHICERPLYISNLGMSSRLVLYSRQPEIAVAQKKRKKRGWRKYVPVEPVAENQKSPFLGNIKEQAAIFNKMYRAPIFPHCPRHGGIIGFEESQEGRSLRKSEWFVLVHINERYLSPREMKRQAIEAKQGKLSTVFAVREIRRGSVFVVGQQEPIHPILQPDSDQFRELEKAFYTFFLAKFLQDKNREVSIHEAAAHLPDAQKSSLREALESIATEVHQQVGFFRLRQDAPEHEELAEAISPEAVCAYQSAFCAWDELRKMGIPSSMVDASRLAGALHVYDSILFNIDHRRTILKAKLKLWKTSRDRSMKMAIEVALAQKLYDKLDSAEKRMRKAAAIARFVNEQLQLAPWTQCDVFSQSQSAQGSAAYQMEVLGVGDPSGCHEGFSYTREYLAHLFQADQGKSASHGGNTRPYSDLRKLTSKELNTLLKKELGLTNAQLAQMERWSKTNLLADFAANHSSTPGKEYLKKYVREKKRPTKDIFLEYKQKLHAAWERQVQALSADHVAPLPFLPAAAGGKQAGSTKNGSNGAAPLPTVAGRTTALGELLEDDSDSEDDSPASISPDGAEDEESQSAPFRLPDWSGKVYVRICRRVSQKGKEEIVVRFNRAKKVVDAFQTKGTVVKRKPDGKALHRIKNPTLLFETRPKDVMTRARSGSMGSRAETGGTTLKLRGASSASSRAVLNLTDMQRKAELGRKSKQRKRKREEEAVTNAYQKPRALNTRAARVKRPTVRLNDKLCELLYKLYKIPGHEHFKRKPRMPDYLQRIPQPISIQDMRDRCKNPNRMYTTRRQLQDDMNLMAMNAENYNRAQHPVALKARELEALVNQWLQEKDQMFATLEREVEEEEEAREREKERFSKGGKGKGKGKGKRGRTRSPTGSPVNTKAETDDAGAVGAAGAAGAAGMGSSPRADAGAMKSSESPPPNPSVGPLTGFMDFTRRSTQSKPPTPSPAASEAKTSPLPEVQPAPRPAINLGSLLDDSSGSSSGEEQVLEEG